MSILKYFGLDVKRCPVCDQNELPGHVCKQPSRWSRRGFLFCLAAAPIVATMPAAPTTAVTADTLVIGDRLTISGVNGLAFHRNAFSLVWKPIGMLASTFEIQCDINRDLSNRIDALYGMPEPKHFIVTRLHESDGDWSMNLEPTRS